MRDDLGERIATVPHSWHTTLDTLWLVGMDRPEPQKQRSRLRHLPPFHCTCSDDIDACDRKTSCRSQALHSTCIYTAHQLVFHCQPCVHEHQAQVQCQSAVTGRDHIWSCRGQALHCIVVRGQHARLATTQPSSLPVLGFAQRSGRAPDSP